MSEHDNFAISCDELKIISDLTVKLTELRQKEYKTFCIENASPEIFARLLHELRSYKKDLIKSE